MARASWQELAGSSCHGAPVPVLVPARRPCAFLSSASSAAFCLYFWVRFSLQQKKEEKVELTHWPGNMICPELHLWDADPISSLRVLELDRVSDSGDPRALSQS